MEHVFFIKLFIRIYHSGVQQDFVKKIQANGRVGEYICLACLYHRMGDGPDHRTDDICTF